MRKKAKGSFENIRHIFFILPYWYLLLPVLMNYFSELAVQVIIFIMKWQSEGVLKCM